jgi:hypothetical protein
MKNIIQYVKNELKLVTRNDYRQLRINYITLTAVQNLEQKNLLIQKFALEN